MPIPMFKLMKGGKDERDGVEGPTLSIEQVVRFDSIEISCCCVDARQAHRPSDMNAHVGLCFAQ